MPGFFFNKFKLYLLMKLKSRQMNSIKYKSLLLSLIAVLCVGSLACGGDDNGGGLTDEQQRLLDLAGTTGVTWTNSTVTFEGQPLTSFEGSTITLTVSGTSGSYTSTGEWVDLLGSSSGTWGLATGNINQIIFNGDLDNVFNISNFSTTGNPSATLTVNYTSNSSGASGTSGTYVISITAPAP